MATQNARPVVAKSHAAATASGVRPADIYYILFRHKWKIVFVSLIGIAAASVVWVRWPHSYQSYAELLIKYIQDVKTPAQNSDSVKPTDDIINPELELLRSRDLAERVVDVITPRTILAKVDGSNNRDEAIGVVAGGISADPVNHSSVIMVTFRHSDAAVVQPVLREIIATYFKLHAELHKIGELDEPLAKEAEQWRNNLLATENDIRSAQTNYGIIFPDDTKKSLSVQLNETHQQLSEANAEYRERKAILDEIIAAQPQHVGPVVKTNADQESIPADVLEDYRRARHMVDYWRKQQSDAEETYVEGSTKRTNIEAQVTAAEKAKKELEEKTPALLAVAPSSVNETDTNQQSVIRSQWAYLKNLEIKIKILNSRLVDIQKGVGTLSAYEELTTDLERKQKLDQETYQRFATAVAEARIADRFRNGQVWNISSIQSPTPPSLVSRGKKSKTVGMILFGAIGGILALVFFIEMYLDQSLKRPVDVENALHLPLFLNIPLLGKNGKARSLGRARKVPLLEDRAQKPVLNDGTAANGGPGVANNLPVQANADVEPAAWDSRHVLRSYSEALRDRLITYFEVNNLHHKPKLVAVTSCSKNAGVSTIAAGLASSLSETGEGNVLLVDMNELGASHQFYKGELACGIDDALEKDKRDNALVQDNLYVVMEETGNDNLPRALPKRFKHLVPRLRASDYDYIIFDMPPVSQISVTPRLARFMDIMLVVVESEKTDRDLVKRATSLLAEADTHVGIVLNKTKKYVPSRLTRGL